MTISHWIQVTCLFLSAVFIGIAAYHTRQCRKDMEKIRKMHENAIRNMTLGQKFGSNPTFPEIGQATLPDIPYTPRKVGK